MPQWLAWVIVGGALAVGEIFTLAFILGPIAFAAVAAGLGVGLPWWRVHGSGAMSGRP